MGKEIRGKTLEYWKANANEDYIKTPISVLKYITILEEELEVKNNIVKSNVINCNTCKRGYTEESAECYLDCIDYSKHKL